MTKKLLGVLMTLLLSWGLDVHAQGTISGKVIASSNSQPVSGASVLLKGKSTGASTNPDGVFSIAAKVGDILVVSGVGIQTFEHEIKQAGTQLISVDVETTQLNEVVVTALGIKKDRKKLGYAIQDFEKYLLTITENISLGSSSLPDPIRMQQAAMLSRADDFISMLPSGFDTLLGRSFHLGEQLSGGQWQKLALARIFYRDTPFVVLDEPTSSLDAMAEHALYEALRSWGKEKIIILVTHRLAQLKYADRIVVFREGRIVEEGTYTALIHQKGYFHQLYGDLP